MSRLRQEFNHEATKKLTIRTGWTIRWDVKQSKVTVKEASGPDAKVWTAAVGEMGGAVQDIYVKGGLESWVRSQIEMLNQ